MLQLALLIGKFAFLLVLYVFIYLVVRSAGRELRTAAQPAAGRPSMAALPLEVQLPGGPLPNAGVPSPGDWALVAASVPRMRNGARIGIPWGGSLLAGRSADTGLQLDDTFVSGHHARFFVGQEGLVVEDLGSTNGTFVNGGEITGPVLLAAGDQVAMGDGVFVVEATP